MKNRINDVIKNRILKKWEVSKNRTFLRAPPQKKNTMHTRESSLEIAELHTALPASSSKNRSSRSQGDCACVCACVNVRV